MQAILIKAVAAIVGGGGGGRPNMAQAGGKNPAEADEAIAAAAGILEGSAEIILLHKDQTQQEYAKKCCKKSQC